MKITRYAMMLAAATGLLSACQKLDEVKAYGPDKVGAPRVRGHGLTRRR